MINIRQAWLKYYSSRGFKVIPSAPLVHPLFPLSFNMSAGLVQIDPHIRKKTKIKPAKKCLVQKCLRYFDIPLVGDGNHLSFFEMPGAFEIAQFEEKETIKMVWEFLTKRLDINPKKLWITTVKKVRIAGKTITLKKNLLDYLYTLAGKRVIIGSKKTNFWTQGGGAKLTDNIKLCGPQIEFFYGTNRKNLLEIGNIIFIKYYLDYNDHVQLKKLINPCTEAVIGLERTLALPEVSRGIHPGARLDVETGETKITPKVKIIGDHLKALCFILAEKEILPGKNGRARIVRTLIRNLLTSCYVLKLEPRKIIPPLISQIIKDYSSCYPEIKKAKKRVLKIVLTHEKVYLKTLERGKRKALAYLKKHHLKKIGNKEKAYFKQKFGLPEKLTNVILK